MDYFYVLVIVSVFKMNSKSFFAKMNAAPTSYTNMPSKNSVMTVIVLLTCCLKSVNAAANEKEQVNIGLVYKVRFKQFLHYDLTIVDDLFRKINRSGCYISMS